jgi:SAM-dependent methyltransferase
VANPQPKSERRRSDYAYEYGADFYRFMASFAVRSARRIVPGLTAALPVSSVVDFGCGHGAWLSVWAEAGASVLGVDGAYVDKRLLLVDPGCFRTADLSGPIDLGRKFDLVQSLEVAEHIPAANSEIFVDTLVAHGALILFSAATPGQGGEHHVNEQPLEYWREIFRARGYAAVDYVRPLIFDEAAIARWYRYNIMLYIRDDMIAALPERVRSCRVPDALPLRDYRPLSYRLRNAVVKRLPAGAVDRVSRFRGVLAARMAGV